MSTSDQKQLVLVVDDEAIMRLLARTTLEQAGFAVEEADDGQAGLAAFERLQPDLVLLDVVMPILDGFDACQALRKLEGGEHAPVLMMTGLDDADSINRAYQVGATDFITKPIAWPMLGHRVRYLLRAQRALFDLQKSQARLTNAQRIAQLGHWEWHVATDQVQRSDEVYRIAGRTPEELSAAHKSFLDIIHPEDRPTVDEALYAALYRQQPFNLHFRIVRLDGTIRTVHEQGEVHYDAAGNPARMQGATQDITERKDAEDQIRQLALYDSLTGLPNRRLFKEQLSHAVARAERSGQVLALLSLDLDRFKRINDTLGHEVGDLLLKETTNRLIKSLRQTDSVTRNDLNSANHCIARQGGDEFTLLLVDLFQAQDAAKVARRILEALSQPFNLNGNEIVMSAGIGIALYPLDGADADSLLKNADAAMHYAKGQHKNNCQYYNGKMNTSALQKITLESNLHRALERHEFVLYYQPKIDATSGLIIGAEALIRWHHPDLGLLSPTEFIPLAEESGLIIPIGEWVIRNACMQTRRWHEAGFTTMQVAVNMSSQNFEQEKLDRTIGKILAECGLDARYLELEMTESTLMREAETMVNTLRRLKATGIRLSIDDFGTGYSSLSYLKRFALDALKIDRSFVHDITSSEDAAAITSAIIAMARSLKIAVIAEGVETDSQAALLRSQGCQFMQGYLFSRPVPAPEFTMLLQKDAIATSSRRVFVPA
jgi:diguanylate cyclase (GGDEF)-like protein/PAS domain S-box-containing protein